MHLKSFSEVKILKIVVAVSLFVLLFAGCAKKQELYTDSKGRFTVEAPKGWKIQELDDPRGKVAFSQGNNNIIVAMEEYQESKTISEVEKNRVRSGMSSGMKDRLGDEISNIWEKSITVDGVEGWIYGFSVPAENLNYKMVMFIKNGRFYTLVSTCSPEQEKTWERFLASFRSK